MQRPYDGEVAYTDYELGRLFETVARKAPPEHTVIAVLSDHGESLSEHGEYTHGVFLYESTLRIVFMMAGPGIPTGLRVKQQARTIDLLPTLLELMGRKARPNLQSTSLVRSFAGKEVPTLYSYMETLHPKINMGWAEFRGIRTNRWKYIRAPKPELYDLVQDPAEINNVIGNHPTEVQELERELNAIIGAGQTQKAEKVETSALDQRTMQQLKSLGYLSGFSQPELLLTGKGTDERPHRDPQIFVSRCFSRFNASHIPADCDASARSQKRSDQPISLLLSRRTVWNGRTPQRCNEALSERHQSRYPKRLVVFPGRPPISAGRQQR